MVLNFLRSWLSFFDRITRMSCKACREAVDAEADRAKHFHAAHKEVCGCEQYSLTTGRVGDDETLHFIVSDPDGIINGFINQILVSQIDANGLSVLRDRAEDAEFILSLEQLSARWAERSRRFCGILNISTHSVRYDEGDRLCCVYDTAEPGKPNHAEIFAPDLQLLAEAQLSKGELKRRSRQRIKKFVEKAGTDFVTPDSFRGGFLKRFEKAAST
jgi:hypothetical protein